MSFFTKSAKKQILELPLKQIVPNPHQPRREFDPAQLAELSASIAQVGICTPLSVRRVGDRWELIAGERRLRAAAMAGLSTVPCISVEADDETSSLLALIENIQRADLDVWDEALALRKLIDHFHLSQEEAARRVGKSQSAVANKLRLLRLPEKIIAELRVHHLSERHARALLRLEDEAVQRAALAHIIRYQLNVAQTEVYIDKLCGASKKLKKAIPIYRTKDIRFFLNSIKKGISMMQSAGVNAQLGREESEQELTLTIHIPK